MAKVRIESNPYEQEIKYYECSENGEYTLLSYETNSASRLLNQKFKDGFFTFYVKKIVDAITKEYREPDKSVTIEFLGTDDEFLELVSICSEPEYLDLVNVERGDKRLANARYILPDITRIFSEYLSPIISKSIDEDKIKQELKKFDDASNDIVPICVLGNYSSGKSTFINALIGNEILPCGDEPVTAKIYQIMRSPSEDKASVELEYENEKFKIVFTENENDIIYTGGDKPLYNDIKERLDNLGSISITKRVNTAINIINVFDKNNKSDSVSNLISIIVPFYGFLWDKGDRNFVIFDTPGSNTASNEKHLEVLKEQMNNLSNGLPLFVSEFDSLDTKDNERLYKIIREVKELDDRFTMIIVNKADEASLPKEGFDAKSQEELLSQAVPKNLYSEGMYFVSSVMGMGAKNKGDFINEHLAEVFDGKINNYSNPSARFYKKLYKYNIMPEQLKEKADGSAESYAQEGDSLIFVNSGLYSVEEEILTFANNYSHYNKCKQAQLFLDRVISITQEEIDSTKAEKEQQRDTMKDSFDEDKKKLIDELTDQSEKIKSKDIEEYPDYMEPHIKTAEIVYTKEQLEDIEADFINKMKEEKDYEERQVDYLKAKVNFNANLRENIGKVLKKRNIEALKELSSDFRLDRDEISRQNDSLKDVKHDVNRTASDELFEKIKGDFTRHVTEAQAMLVSESAAYWNEKSEDIRNTLIEIVTGSSALSDEKKTEITDLILSYEALDLDDIAENEFIRDDFERGIWIGKIKIVSLDRLNISKLVNKYRNKTIEIVSKLKEQISETHKGNISAWVEKLLNRIIANIVDYNPALQEKSQNIQALSEKVEELEKRRLDLDKYTNQIKEMMDWSDVG